MRLQLIEKILLVMVFILALVSIESHADARIDVEIGVGVLSAYSKLIVDENR